MEIIRIEKWEDFGTALGNISNVRAKIAEKTGVACEQPLFRGIGSNNWGLQTTLDRHYRAFGDYDIEDLAGYYRLAFRSHSTIETITEREWPNTPQPDEFLALLPPFKTLGAQSFFRNQSSVYRFLIYLRHHGFPSPLLDWTASPYIAAFFAFDQVAENTGCVSVYSIIRGNSFPFSSGTPQITLLGPYIRSHRRHTIQQSSYTICMDWDPNYRFSSHDRAIECEGSLGTEGVAVRIDIPACEQVKALTSLDLMNINAYSLFGSEDSLMRMLAHRSGLYARTPNSKNLKNPPHPGDLIRTEVIEALGLSVSKAADILKVRRGTLSGLLSARTSLTADMALRIEKAFGPEMDHLLRMQLAYDVVKTRECARELSIDRYVPANKQANAFAKLRRVHS